MREDGNVQGPASEVRETMVESVGLAALDRGEMPINILTRHSSFSSGGTFSALVSFLTFCFIICELLSISLFQVAIQVSLVKRLDQLNHFRMKLLRIGKHHLNLLLLFY